MFLTRRAFLVVTAIASLIGAGCSQSTSEIPPENRLRIVDWNLEWFPGGKPDATPEQQAAQMATAKEAISQMQPDVLLLQEVRDWQAAAEVAGVIPKGGPVSL